LIVLGPQRLPELARTLGGWFAAIKQAADDALESVAFIFQDLRDTLMRAITDTGAQAASSEA
jgi:Sec-independent protein translocase protein TatA